MFQFQDRGSKRTIGLMEAITELVVFHADDHSGAYLLRVARAVEDYVRSGWEASIGDRAEVDAAVKALAAKAAAYTIEKFDPARHR